jgi:hypothetical protein
MKLICLAHEQVCEGSDLNIGRIDLEEQPHVEHPAALWEIECMCSQENCDRSLLAFTLWDLSKAARGELTDRIVKVKPTAAFCSSGHEIEWQPEKIKATMWPF